MIRFFCSHARARASVPLIRSPSRNQFDPAFCRALTIEHRRGQIVRLQETHMIQIFCSFLCERASSRAPPGNHLYPTFFSGRGRTRTTQRSFWARSSAELNPGDPDFPVRILQSSRGSTNSPTFYLPSSIGVLKLNFRNAITLGLHERACWPDFTWTMDELISCSCTCETCFFVCFSFSHLFCLFIVSP